MKQTPRPKELRVPPDRAALRVAFDDGQSVALSAEYLRVFTPSAERTGHGARQVIGGKKDVCIDAITPIGHYAIRIVFSDGHDTGIYPLTSLLTLHTEFGANWSTYLDELRATGLDRERAGTAPAPTRVG